jgi:hypothetical protein
MKKFSVIIAAAFFYLSCQKEEASKQVQSLNQNNAGSFYASSTAITSKAKKDNEELQTLIRAWTEWAYRDISVAPFLDTDGSLQNLAQPYSSGTFMLAGGVSPDPVSRTVTISLSQYQYIFVPLVSVSIFYNECDPSFGPKGGQNPKAFFQSLIKEAFNGPRDLDLLWDGTSLLSTKQKDARANSGVWSFIAGADFVGHPCAAGTLSTAFSDGYWAKIPLALGTHTLMVGGDLHSGKLKFEFSNIVNYTIHVIG